MKVKKLLAALFLLIAAGCAAEKKEDTVIINEDGLNTVKLGEKEMDWFRFGNENGPKVIILPGISLKSVTGSKDAIIGAYSLLAENYDVYLLDHIRIIPEGYEIHDMAEDTVRAIRAIGLDEVSIMGVSHGAMLAMDMAISNPDLIHSIMLCSAASRITDPTPLETWKKLAEERNLPALMEAFGEYVYTPSFYEQYKDIIIASGQGASEQDYSNFIISVEGTLDFDCYDQLEKISCPAFVIGASQDKVLGVQASYDLVEKLHCDSFIYEGYGHGVYDEAPDYLTHIKAFLDEVNQ